MLHRAMQNSYFRIAIALFATFMYALGINWFIVPMGLYTGGLLGACQVLRTVLESSLGLPESIDFSGILYLLFNIPIFLLGWRSMGRGFLLRTLVCTAACSFFLSVLHSPATPFVEETLTNCIIGGILVGASAGLIFTCGCSSGGLDIIGLWLTKRGSRFTVGRFSLSFNAVLYTVCALMFGVTTALYSTIYTVLTSLFMDRFHEQNINVQALIFTRRNDAELPNAIISRLGRSATYWMGKGAYTGEDVRVLCVCVSKFEESELRALVHETDPGAFLVVQEGVSIGGNFPHRVSM